MNNLRIPVGILVLIVIALGAWYFLSHSSSSPQPSQTTSFATTTATASTQSVTTSAPSLDTAAVAANIVGSWQSTDDFNYTINVDANGRWIDEYGYDSGTGTSSASQTGTYTLFTSVNPDKDFTGVLVPGVVYVKVVEGSSTLYFSVLKATNDELQLSYLDRGNTLSFVRPKGL